MDTVRVSSKGQIVIPKNLRKALHLEAGSEILLRKTEQRFTHMDIANGFGLLAKPGHQAPVEADIKRTVGAMLKQNSAAK